MKKVLSLILAISFVFICGCNSASNTDSNPTNSTSSTLIGEKNPLLTDADWIGQDESCENHITFKNDNSFLNSCSCGEPIGDSDLAEKYSYNSADKTIELYDSDDAVIETAKILFLDKYYLVLNVWGKTYTYANKKLSLPTVHTEAKENVDSTQSFACLSVFGYADGKITASSHDYDGDAADNFEKWQLNAASEISFDSVSVVDDNGMVIVDEIALPESEYQYIGDYYTCGFFEFNENGQVSHVTFYGETIIEE